METLYYLKSSKIKYLLKHKVSGFPITILRPFTCQLLFIECEPRCLHPEASFKDLFLFSELLEFILVSECQVCVGFPETFGKLLLEEKSELEPMYES